MIDDTRRDHPHSSFFLLPLPLPLPEHPLLPPSLPDLGQCLRTGRVSGRLSDSSRQCGTGFAKTTLFHWLFDGGVACQSEALRWLMGTSDGRFRFGVVVLRSFWCEAASIIFFIFFWGGGNLFQSSKAVEANDISEDNFCNRHSN